MLDARPTSRMRYLAGAIALLILVVAPNLIWLGTSTLRVQNGSNQPISAVGFLACETTHTIGTLQPDESIFRVLEACGEDTVEIVVGDSRFCQMYVEGEIYHVDALITAIDAVACSYDDLLSSLFIKKALW